jgi:3-phosphoshikimate 1-carboxyvinyltransferase
VRVVAAPLATRPLSIDATRSSQHATAILVAATRLGGVTLTLRGEPVSRAYLALTLESLAAFGVEARVEGPVVVVGGAPPRGARVVVEPDASSAAAWWAAAALTSGDAVVAGLPASTSQPDAALLDVLARMGARVERAPTGEARVVGTGALVGAGDVDLRATPDLAPLVAALAAGAQGTTRVVHAPHLADKESDRIATCVAAVRAVGGDADPSPGGFVVRGRPLSGGRVLVAGDHRLALAFGVLGLAVEGVTLSGASAVAKSWPGFLEAVDRAARGSAV